VPVRAATTVIAVTLLHRAGWFAQLIQCWCLQALAQNCSCGCEMFILFWDDLLTMSLAHSCKGCSLLAYPIHWMEWAMWITIFVLCFIVWQISSSAFCHVFGNKMQLPVACVWQISTAVRRKTSSAMIPPLRHNEKCSTSEESMQSLHLSRSCLTGKRDSFASNHWNSLWAIAQETNRN